MLTIDQIKKDRLDKKYTLMQCAEVFAVSYRTILRWKEDRRIHVKQYSRAKQLVTGQAIIECDKRADRPAV